MKWANLDTLAVDTVVPAGYRYEQLSRDDIVVLSEKIRSWYPDISVGAAQGFLKPSFYEDRVYLAGESEKDLIVYVCKKAGAIVSMAALERDPQNATIQGRLAVVSPLHRRSGIARFGPFIIDQQARAMGIAMAYNRVSLKHLYAQRLVESAGFELVGILPASDMEAVAPGIVKHVPEALYAKVYAATSKMFTPKDECMSESTRQLWHQLFGPGKRT